MIVLELLGLILMTVPWAN